MPKPKWGARRAVLNDLGPAASFISANYTLPFDVNGLREGCAADLVEVEKELGWMYETTSLRWQDKGRINFTVWSEVFTCPECAGEVEFLEEALDDENKSVPGIAFHAPIAMLS